MAIKRVKCPTCGKILKFTVEANANVSDKIFTCPACKTKHRVKDCKTVVPKPRVLPPGDKTIYGIPLVNRGCGQPGCLVDGKKKYDLVKGVNIVGRQHHHSIAGIQVNDASGYMSSYHFVIDAKESNGDIVHYFSIFHKVKNPTFINNTIVNNGDKLVLNDGDVIKIYNTHKTEVVKQLIFRKK